jgi:hypothetical protein
MSGATIDAITGTEEKGPAPLSWSRGGGHGLAGGRKSATHTPEVKVGCKEIWSIPYHKRSLPCGVLTGAAPTMAYSQCVSCLSSHAI